MKKNIIYLLCGVGVLLMSGYAGAYLDDDDDDDDNIAQDAQGRTYRREGNIIYRNDGTIYYQSGNTITGSDGSYWQQSGNTYYEDGEEKCREVSGRIICDN